MQCRLPDRRRSQAGLSLVETCGVISLTGVLAATFIPTFARQLRFSKISEATEQLDGLYRGAAAYYARDRQGSHARCLPESAGPTPSEPSVEPVWVDFTAANVEGHATWTALGRTEPLRVRYAYEAIFAVSGCGPFTGPPRPIATFRATGDLDGDGVHSTLERTATLSSGQQSLLPAGPLRITQRVE